ncbi:MAG: hypothetical protein M0Z56_04745, partial [Desulfobacteraceae bacterium]|nr:hypothetical protein [Desulfobacteraceae bacterium]
DALAMVIAPRLKRKRPADSEDIVIQEIQQNIGGKSVHYFLVVSFSCQTDAKYDQIKQNFECGNRLKSVCKRINNSTAHNGWNTTENKNSESSSYRHGLSISFIRINKKI